MIIDCISDLHGHYPKLEGGDLLIVAGDLTARDTVDEYRVFFSWFTAQDYRKKILIAGNHDNSLQGPWPGNTKGPFREDKTFYDFEYLCDSGTEFEYFEQDRDEPGSKVSIDCIVSTKKKLKIWGSPWTKTFPGMNPKCKAFTCDTEEELAEKWALIPQDTDILVTHGPPYGIFDTVIKKAYDDKETHKWHDIWCHTGSDSLHEKSVNIAPKVHCYGHIHEQYNHKKLGDTWYVNASHVNERYEPVNKPVRIEL